MKRKSVETVKKGVFELLRVKESIFEGSNKRVESVELILKLLRKLLSLKIVFEFIKASC